MKYKAQGETQWQISVIWGKAWVLYLSQDSHQELYIPYERNNSAWSVLLYFTLKEVFTKYASLKFNALSTHLLNKEWLLW